MAHDEHSVGAELLVRTDYGNPSEDFQKATTTSYLAASCSKYVLVWANLPEAKSSHPLHPCSADTEHVQILVRGR